jgi:hypothetical protein
MMHSSELSIRIWTTWPYIPGDGNCHNYHCENLKSYKLNLHYGWKTVIVTTSYFCYYPLPNKFYVAGS